MRGLLKRGLLFLLVIGLTYWFGWQRGRGERTVNEGQPTDGQPAKVTDSAAATDSQSDSATLPDTVTADEALPGTGGGEIVHVVKAGETLHTIGLQYDLLWTTIATANNLDPNNPVIKEGDLLRIPLTSGGEVTKEETLNIDANAAKTTQEHVNNGELTWRTDPIVVVRRTTPTEYHLQNEDSFTLSSVDYDNGRATVEVEHDAEKLVVDLTQPVDKGNNGVWFITKIRRTALP